MHHDDKYMSIISPVEMLDQIIPQDIILITTSEFQSVLKQLESYDKLKNTECFFIILCDGIKMNMKEKKA